MLASVKLGLFLHGYRKRSVLSARGRAPDGAGDLPEAVEHTGRKGWQGKRPDPYERRKADPIPPYLSPEGCAGVLGYKGDFGLKGAMDAQDPLRVNVWDQGAGQDADVPGDFRAMEQYAKAHRGVSERICGKPLRGSIPAGAYPGPLPGGGGAGGAYGGKTGGSRSLPGH